ncbi:MAG: hypothetical protein KDB23_06810 [Planctomycetales bacterium]|nr:hypothetical protein [Planctomycetales bacterium]
MARQVSGKRALSRIIDETPRPVYLVDATRRLLFCNDACLTWLNLTESEVVGMTCRYHAVALADTKPWDGLCPPPAAFGAESTHGTIWYDANGQRSYREVQFLKLSDQPDVLVAIAATDASTNPPGLPPAGATRDPDHLHTQLIHFAAGRNRTNASDQLVGVSPAIRRVRRQFELACQNGTATLVTGPPGSECNQLLRAIAAARALTDAARLLPIDCSLLDAELFESVLMPQIEHAVSTTAGRVQILLFDVDRLQQPVQPLLVALLEDSVGLAADVMATAECSLENVDSYDRRLREHLSVLTLQLPPLVDRLEDVPLLAQNFVELLNAEAAIEKSVGGFSPEAMDRLVNHSWKRNIDELREVVSSAFALCDSSLIQIRHLPERLTLAADAELYPLNPPETIQLDEYLQSIEKELLERALRVANGNRAQAARLLGIPRVRLLRRLEAAGLAVRPDIPFIPVDDESTE